MRFVAVLLVAVRDTSFGQVVRRKLDIDPIAHKDPNAIPSHAARDRRRYDMLAILDLNLEKRIGLFIDHNSG